MAHDLGGDEADAPDVGVAVLAAEAEALGQMRAHDVAVEERDLPPALEQQLGEHVGRRGLAAAAQPGEPHAHALPVARRIGLGEDLGDFRPREPLRQRAPLVEIALAHLGARDGGRPRPRGHPAGLLVAVLIGQVHELVEGHHADPQLVAVARDHFLSVVGTIEGLALGVVARARVVAPDDEVVGAVVATDQRVP